jgi:hypothetical protein
MPSGLNTIRQTPLLTVGQHMPWCWRKKKAPKSVSAAGGWLGGHRVLNRSGGRRQHDFFSEWCGMCRPAYTKDGSLSEQSKLLLDANVVKAPESVSQSDINDHAKELVSALGRQRKQDGKVATINHPA